MYSILLSAGWPIWPLLIISIIGLAVVIERAWYLRQIHIFPKDSLEIVFGLANAISQQKTVSEPEINAISQLSPVRKLFACILREKASGSSADSALEELQASAQTTWLTLERYLGILATIATVAPLLGLFGTVIGMIEIFGSQGAVGGAGSPQQLAHGISVALYNTAFGLIVAIPALIFWRYFRARVDEYLLTLELSSERLLRHLLTLRK